MRWNSARLTAGSSPDRATLSTDSAARFELGILSNRCWSSELVILERFSPLSFFHRWGIPLVRRSNSTGGRPFVMRASNRAAYFVRSRSRSRISSSHSGPDGASRAVWTACDASSPNWSTILFDHDRTWSLISSSRRTATIKGVSPVRIISSTGEPRHRRSTCRSHSAVISSVRPFGAIWIVAVAQSTRLSPTYGAKRFDCSSGCTSGCFSTFSSAFFSSACAV